VKRLWCCVLLLSGCLVGPRAEDLDPVATRPSGVNARVFLRSGNVIYAELVAVHDSVVYLWDERLLLVPIEAIRSASLDRRVNVSLYAAQPSSRQLKRIGALSRFPYGMSAAQQDSLLRRSGQSEPERVTRE
jgi:hypothetical protein